VRTIDETVALKALQLKPAHRPEDRAYDFYRCYSCRRVITRADELRAFRVTDNGGRPWICACGSGRYSPTWPVAMEWLQPRIVSFVAKLVLARAVAPLAEKRAPFLLSYLERLVA
jgi:hypothetical protein